VSFPPPPSRGQGAVPAVQVDLDSILLAELQAVVSGGEAELAQGADVFAARRGFPGDSFYEDS